MSDDQPHDPWASLADSLGATPAPETPQPRPAAKPQQPPARAKTPVRPKTEPVTGDWDSLASDLGIEGSPPPPPRPAPRPAEARAPEALEPRRERTIDEPRHERRESEPRRERRHDDDAPRGERPPRRSDEPRPPRRETHDLDDRPIRSASEDHDSGDDLDAPRGDADAPPRGEDDRGPGRRRRRGRRGGRGRGRRGDDRREPRGGDALSADGESVRPTPRFDDEPVGGPVRDHELDHADDIAASDDAHGDDGHAAASADRGDRGDDERGEDRPRRRRRRGRRGGRSRNRTSADAGTERPAERAPRAADSADLDDEPLPTSYGMRRPTPPGEASRGERPAETGDRESSESGGRRRRRRGGEGRSRGERGGARGAESGQGRGRSRGQRRSSDDSRSSSYSRGRRDDFAPVAGRNEEDDEGLEFLGVEEAGQEPARRTRMPEDDDILVESGLTSVLDVPSWVEAIGIVIAGNLDARNRAGRGDGKHR